MAVGLVVESWLRWRAGEMGSDSPDQQASVGQP